MLRVMDLHRFRINKRLQGIVGIRQRWQRKGIRIYDVVPEMFECIDLVVAYQPGGNARKAQKARFFEEISSIAHDLLELN